MLRKITTKAYTRFPIQISVSLVEHYLNSAFRLFISVY